MIEPTLDLIVGLLIAWAILSMNRRMQKLEDEVVWAKDVLTRWLDLQDKELQKQVMGMRDRNRYQ